MPFPMKPPAFPPCLVSALLATAGCVAAADEGVKIEAGKPLSYWKHVRPILQANCQGCHQPAKPKGGYVMTDFAAMVKGGDDDGVAVVPHKPEESALIKNIVPDAEGHVAMPKKADPLRKKDVEIVRRWIAEGALDDTPAHARQVWNAEHPPLYSRPNDVTAIDFSNDGQILAISGFHEVLLVNTADGKCSGRLVGLAERIESVSFSPDGTLLAVTGGLPGRMGEVQIWNVAKKELILSFPVTFDTIYGASWSPDGRHLAFGCADKTVRAIDVTAGRQSFFVMTHEDWVQDTAWSTKGDQVISVGRDMTAKLSEFRTQRFIDNITSITPGALKGGLQAVTRHPLRDEIVVAGATGEPLLYRLNREVERKIGDDSNLVRKFPSIEGRIWSAEFSPDGKKFVVGGSLDDGGIVAIYGCEVDSKLPEEVKAIFRKTSGERNAEERAKVEAYHTAGVTAPVVISVPSFVHAVTFKPDGSAVAAAGADGHVRLFNPQDGTSLGDWQPFPIEQTQAAK